MALTEVIVSKVENSLIENNEMGLIEMAEIYKQRNVFNKFLGYSYCRGVCNIFHVAIKHANTNTLTTLFSYIKREMGEDFLETQLNESLDKVGRTVLIIAAKHRERQIILFLLKKYGIDPSFYPPCNGKSAFSYVLQRKKLDIGLTILNKMDTSRYDRTAMEYFRSDMILLRSLVSDQELRTTKWATALTARHVKEGRTSKQFKPVHERPTSLQEIALANFKAYCNTIIFSMEILP